MNQSPDRLYELLPVVYRLRDAERGEPLRTLLNVIAEQVNLVEADIAQTYDNWFIETCDEWVVPYIADLLGYTMLRNSGEPDEVVSPGARARQRILIPRRDVANVIHYRRRKGALALLELLARDAASYPSARVVEFYKLLARTQAVNFPRVTRGRTVNLRDGDALDLLAGAFDKSARSVDLRRAVSHRAPGRFNIPGIGIFVWRLKSYPVTKTPAYCVEEEAPECYTFSVLGHDTPLYNDPQPESEPTQIAGELNLPTPIRRRAFEKRIVKDGKVERSEASEKYYDRSLSIFLLDRSGNLKQIPREQIIPSNLSDWGKYRPPRDSVAVDPRLGRIVFPSHQKPRYGVVVSYQYAFSADVGGGEYDRPLSQPKDARIYRVGRDEKFKKIKDALDAWESEKARYAAQSVVDAAVGANAAEAAKAAREKANTFTTEPEKTAADNVAKAAKAAAKEPGATAASVKTAAAKAAAEQRSKARSKNDDVTLETGKENEPSRAAVIEIRDSGVYTEQLQIDLKAGESLQIRAANRCRPVIRLLDYQSDLPDALTVKGEKGSRFTLDGLLVSGRSIQIIGSDFAPNGDSERRREDEHHEDYEDNQEYEQRKKSENHSGDKYVSKEKSHTGDLCDVTIRHCTLVPGWSLHCDCEPQRPNDASLELDHTSAQINIEHSILGTIEVEADERAAEPTVIRISDSILDATGENRIALGTNGGGMAYVRLSIARATVIGIIKTHAIVLAENSIFKGLVTVGRRMQGCVRFCYVAPGSRTPRRYECQPDLVERAVETDMEAAVQNEIEAAKARERTRVEPQFNSERYGSPTYCQLAQTCAEEIARGADDESEMGAFHDLYQPQRMANLRARLDEYTPADAEVGIIYAG
jgi:hypothetical protein